MISNLHKDTAEAAKWLRVEQSLAGKERAGGLDPAVTDAYNESIAQAFGSRKRLGLPASSAAVPGRRSPSRRSPSRRSPSRRPPPAKDNRGSPSSRRQATHSAMATSLPQSTYDTEFQYDSHDVRRRPYSPSKATGRDQVGSSSSPPLPPRRPC